MTALVFSILLFLAAHILPALPRPRGWLIARLGERTYLSAYGIATLLLLGWVGLAYAQADRSLLWETEYWMRALTLAAMLPVCLLLVITFTAPNPYSIGIGSKGFDPSNPGPLRLTRHPLLHALAIWSAAHFLVNGDGASVLMFGFFFLLALAGFPMLKAKRKHVPAMQPARLGFSDIGLWRIVLAILLYALLIWAHPYVIGVNPLYQFV
jgi:uncharacterized membrane protein